MSIVPVGYKKEKEPSLFDKFQNLFSSKDSDKKSSDALDCTIYENAMIWLNLSENSTLDGSGLRVAYGRKVRLYISRINDLKRLNSGPLIEHFEKLLERTDIAYKTILRTINQGST